MQDKFAQQMGTLYRKLFGFKDLEDFVRTSIDLGKNNFRIYGNMSIHNLGFEHSPFNGHIYSVDVASSGYRHLTRLAYNQSSKVKRALVGSDRKPIIDWQIDEKRMLENMEYTAKTIRSVSDELGIVAPIERTVNKVNYGEPYSRFDEGPTGFIS